MPFLSIVLEASHLYNTIDEKILKPPTVIFGW